MSINSRATIRPLALSMVLLCAALHANALQVQLEVYAASCAGNDGAVITTVTGGTPPFSYSWSDGSTETDRFGLLPGTYTVTVTDQLGQVAVEEAWVTQGGAPMTGSMLMENVFFSGLAPCTGQCNGGFRLYLLRQTGGYSINTTPPMSIVENIANEGGSVSMYQLYEIVGACAGQNIQLSVSNACGSGNASFTMPALLEPSITVGEITGSCTGANNGTIAGQITVVADIPLSEDMWMVRAINDQGVQVSPVQNTTFMMGTYNFQFMNLLPGNWTLRFTTVEFSGSAQQPCVLEVPVIVPNLGTACATLSGTVHYETDLDCVQDGLEMGIPYQMMKVTPGPMYAITSNGGGYSMALPYGSYALQQLNPNAVQLCPPTAPIAFSVSNGSNAVVHIADSMLTSFDMWTYVLPGISRVGYPFKFALRLYNGTGASGENVTVTLTHDPLFS
ncbi:MAG: SprB repeat-containing protein, partial [Flavobacteriales bacterium]